MNHDVPLHHALPASDLRQRCWQAPAGLFFEAEELHLGCGGLPDLRRVVLLVGNRPGGLALGQGHLHRQLLVASPLSQSALPPAAGRAPHRQVRRKGRDLTGY